MFGWNFVAQKKLVKKKRTKANKSKLVPFGVTAHAVPIDIRKANISLTSDKIVSAVRKHFPVIPACAMTIHKSQGATFDDIVYEYSKNHVQELVYVALSRCTPIDKLYITTKDDDETKFRFHHNRKKLKLKTPLVKESERLSLNRLQTKAASILDFISHRKGNLLNISIMTLNCQSLKCHYKDFTDSVTLKTIILFLTETWIDNDEKIDIPNFNCIAQFKIDNVRSAGCAIYQNTDNTTNVLTRNMNIVIRNTADVSVNLTDVGDICECHCKTDNDLEIVMAVVYISQNKKYEDVQLFFHRNLGEYSKEIS